MSLYGSVLGYQLRVLFTVLLFKGIDYSYYVELQESCYDSDLSQRHPKSCY